MSRLRWKLLTAMLAVVVVTLGLSGAFTRRVTHEQVRRLLVTVQPAVDAGLLRALEQHYRTHGWEGIDAVLKRLAGAAERRAALASPEGRVIAVSGDLRNADVAVDEAGRLAVTRRTSEGLSRMVAQMPASPLRNAAGTVVANAYFLPADESGALELSAFAALDSRLAAAFAVATAVAIFLTVLLSRRITSPLERLTAAIEGLARGESPARIQRFPGATRSPSWRAPSTTCPTRCARRRSCSAAW